MNKKVLTVNIFLIIIIILAIITGVFVYRISKASKELSEITEEIIYMEEMRDTLKVTYDQDMDEYILFVSNFNTLLNEKVDTIIFLKEKYSKALSISNKQDFTLKELIYLDEICKEYEIPIEIMLAIYEKESTFNSLARNKTSNATGYGQITPKTAKSIYENYLKLGTYSIDDHYAIASDKQLNILMTCRLMKYNIDSYGNYWTAVEKYFGHKDAGKRYAYAVDINNKMSKYGKSLK